MNKLKRQLLLFAAVAVASSAFAQYENSGISAGFFDSSENSTINFSTFHLPPLSVLYENAKENPMILDYAKAQEIAEAEVAKQKRHIFSYVTGHASYSYGKSDMWGNNSSSYNTMIYQFQGSEQSYWNVGVNIAVPLEDILDLSAAVKRKRMEAERAQIKKDQAYDDLKREIAHLYIKITNSLIALKTASENAAIYQGAGQLNQEDFHQGNMTIERFADTKRWEQSAVSIYQNLQTQITQDIITMEIMTHTPIITNTTTDITLDGNITKSQRQLEKEKKELDKRIKKEAEEEREKIEKLEKEEKERKRQAEKEEREARRKAEKEAKKKK